MNVARPDLVYLFWPTVMAYLRIATHPAIFERPLDPAEAAGKVRALLDLPHARTGSEMERFWEVWTDTTQGLVVRGNLIPDAHLVTLM